MSNATINHGDHRELCELLARVAIGTVSRTDSTRLNALLADDPAARAIYIDYVAADAMLRWRDNAAAPRDPISSILIDSVVHRSSGIHGGWRIAAALAIGLVIVGIIAAVVTTRPGDDPPAPVVGPVVAVLSDSDSDVLIESTGDLVYAGAPLRTGWIKVPEGTAEIAFDSGAMVRVVGPARFRLDSKMNGALSSGRLAADVPPNAVGFTIGVGDLRVVDLGTKFGIEISADGEPGVHVFDGSVRLDGRGGGKVVNAGSAYRASAGGLASIPLNRAAFSGMIAAMSDAEPPANASLAIWLAADRGIERDSDGRVRSWHDSRARVDHFAVQNGPASRPAWTVDGINTRPAVRFAGQQYMQLPTTESLGIASGDYEVFIVARTDDPGVQFLVAGSHATGVENYELHLNGGVGLRFIPSKLNDPAGYADAGRQGDTVGAAHVFHGRIVGDTATVAIDGADSDDTVTLAGREPWVGELTIGMRGDAGYPLRGDITEVLIYNASLSIEDRSAVYEYLSNRYGIETRLGGSDKPANHDTETDQTQTPTGVDP